MRSTPIALGLVATLLGCATPRYIGTLSEGSTYVNRGYGLVLPLAELTPRWWIFDPEAPDKGPPELAPDPYDDRIDLDGDGMLRLDELTSRYQPTLRLLARTSTSARIELEVEILSEPAASEVTLRGLFDSEVRARAGNPTAARLAIENAEERTLALDREALVTSIIGVKGGGAERLALVDQSEFQAEEGVVRRQLVRVRLAGPVLRPEWLRDFDVLLEGLLASHQGGPATRRERW